MVLTRAAIYNLMRLRFRGVVYNSIIETIGSTPIIRLKRLESLFKIKTQLYAKLEFFNPLGSVKDRIGVALIEDLKCKGLARNGVVVEPTSGNTGIAIAFAAASMGYRSVIIIPEGVSVERKKMLFVLGARLVFINKRKGMKAALKSAAKFVTRVPFAKTACQFENETNCKTHKDYTGAEIYNDIGCVDYFVAGVGTGGVITGVGQFLKQNCANTRVVAVEPWSSSILSGKKPGFHRIQGIGTGFLPKIVNVGLFDYIFRVKNFESLYYAKLMAKTEGVPVGLSSGAVVCAGINLALAVNNGFKKVLMLLPSFAERYGSTRLFSLF